MLDRCSVDAENVWFVATGAVQSGPIVMLKGSFRGNGRSEAHQRWSTGMLYDNCVAPDGGIEIRNRGAMGSGHGWGMGWGVIWNCVTKEYIVQNPPGALNWLIGSTGHSGVSSRPFGAGPKLPEGMVDAPGTPVAPRSLYLAQLAERLGPQALKNIGYSSTSPDSAIGGEPGRPARAMPAMRVEPDKVLGANLALNRPVLTGNMRGERREFAGWQAPDKDDKTYWATDDGKTPATLELDTEGSLEINAVEIGEAAGLTGQVQGYKVEGFVESAWKLLAQGTTIGERKIDRFPKATVWKVKLTILQAEPHAAIRKLGLYLDTVSPGEGFHPAGNAVETGR